MTRKEALKLKAGHLVMFVGVKGVSPEYWLDGAFSLNSIYKIGGVYFRELQNKRKKRMRILDDNLVCVAANDRGNADGWNYRYFVRIGKNRKLAKVLFDAE